VTAPFASGAFSAIPALGTVCLAAGLIIGSIQRKIGLIFYTFPFALSEISLSIATVLRGKGGDVTALITIFLAGAATLCSLYLIYRTKGARLAAAALSLFSTIYALSAFWISLVASGASVA
jgi:hypothetical protein